MHGHNICRLRLEREGLLFLYSAIFMLDDMTHAWLPPQALKHICFFIGMNGQYKKRRL